MIQYVVEFFGTFFFLSVIVATGQPFLIAAALLAVILLGAATSGAHFNPAVSLMFWMKGDLGWRDLLGYVGAQVAGGLTALYVFRAFLEPMRNVSSFVSNSAGTNFMTNMANSVVANMPTVGTPMAAKNAAAAAMNTTMNSTMNATKSVSPFANMMPNNRPPMGGFRYRV